MFLALTANTQKVYRCSGSAFPTPGPRKLCCLNLRAYPQGSQPCPQPRAPADLSLQLSKVNTEFGCPEISVPALQNRSRDVLRPGRRRQRFSSMQHHLLHLLCCEVDHQPRCCVFSSCPCPSSAVEFLGSPFTILLLNN